MCGYIELLNVKIEPEILNKNSKLTCCSFSFEVEIPTIITAAVSCSMLPCFDVSWQCVLHARVPVSYSNMLPLKVLQTDR